METLRSIYKNISPLDHHYFLSNPRLFKRLSECLSEEASIKYLVRVEAALLVSLLEELAPELAECHRGLADRLEAEVQPDEVYAEEEKTQHNIRALVNVMKRKVPEELSPYVHLGATSADILDTAASLRIRDAVRDIILPELIEVLLALAGLAEREADTPQVGRTHGQHAVPISFGWAMAEYVSRLGGCLVAIEAKSGDLRGKLAGAVGAYNATSLLVADPERLEKAFLSRLGLAASEHSTQLVAPEYLLRLLLELNTAFGVLANLADDLRNLQRSEIAELREKFGADQVGSSTMPQKRNPWNSEHVKSLWKAFAPRALTFFMDQISEHQRDLTNSASSRFVGEYLAGFAAAVARMGRILASLGVDRTAMQRNLAAGGDLVMAEAAYILLAGAGRSDAHEIVRQLTLACEHSGASLADELKKDSSSWRLVEQRLKKVNGLDAAEFFGRPELYRGLACEKTKRLASEWRDRIQKLKEALE